MRHHASRPNPLDCVRFNPTQPRYAHAISRVYIMESPPRSMIKRPRTSPTYETPIRPHKRRSFKEVAEKENLLLPRRKLLSPSTELERESALKGPGNWDYEEVKALVMFVLFHCKGDAWPAHRRMDLWDEAGKFIKMKTGGLHQRSSSLHVQIIY